ncbi:MAG: redoxin domain-containing protein [Gemmatimonadetes bacterium]|nr:redoxin domain-containing protein [Gemmatimonadota bacterium]MYA65185.1 redoxin domain-containing protein [Gemmatimonadota bacterium]MYB97696.1 redoxin domain-containing protein [Gemmatimonadota bacterium]MYH51504.1 redoxin domain-containing protein [Gemmatimonadota bacterium]MYI45165.1 redoxin domain-containing protein [Gemmatimonadota bacterium]
MSDLARRTTRSAFLIVALGALAVVLGLRYGGTATVTGTGEPGDPRIDSRAVAVLEASDESFANSQSLHAVYEMKGSSGSTEQAETTVLRLARPNLFHITAESRFAYEGPTGPDDPTLMRRESKSTHVLASGGETKWSIRTTEGSPAPYCTTAEMGPPDRMREVDSFNTIHWSFFDFGPWLIRSAVPGHWSTKWRLEDPGLRSVDYVGKDEVDGVPVDVIDWHYKIAYNYPDDDPLYKSRLYIGEDGFTRKIVTTTEGEGGSVWTTANTEHLVTEIREGGKADPADFAFNPPEGTECRTVDPDHGLSSGKYADLPIGTPAPDFTLESSLGGTITLSELAAENKAVLMIFWGYSCAGCRVEMPHVEQLHRELNDKGLTVLTVTYDEMETVRRLVEYNGITHPIVSDASGVLDENGYSYLSMPEVYENYNAYDGKHYIIDPEGRIASAFSKFGVSIPIFREELKRFGIE